MHEYDVKTEQGLEEIKSRLMNLIQAIENYQSKIAIPASIVSKWRRCLLNLTIYSLEMNLKIEEYTY